MAKFTTGPGATEGIDFTDFDDLLLIDDEGTPTITETTHHVRTVAADDINEFQGTGFRYTANNLTGGTLRTVFTSDSANDAWRLSDFSMSVATANKHLDNADSQVFLSTVFARNDSVAGSGFADNLLGYRGNDTVDGGGGNDTLDGDVGNDVLSGDGGNDSLIGGAGNDTLDGVDGNDTMDGGAGKDVYVVDTVIDQVVETDANSRTGGVDTVLSQMSAYTLTPSGNVENLTLDDKADDGTGHSTGVGNELANVITGNERKNTLVGLDGNDKLIGNGGDDSLVGSAGKDTLDGGDGADSLVGGDGDDSMAGGLGDDVYGVDSARDRVSERITNLKDGGTDTVESSISYRLGANLDDLVLTGGVGNSGTGNTAGNRIFGDGSNNELSGLTGDDTLTGNGGDDTLDGGAGDDSMAGGGGDDTYVLGSTEDVFIENDNEGSDTVEAPFDIDLTDDTTFKNIENATLLGRAIEAIGDAGANTLTGNNSANALTGNEGDDTLDGGRGNDTLDGGAGDDLYVVNSVRDVIVESGDGNDTVRSSISIDLAADAALYGGIEHIELTGRAALKATGDDKSNKLTGNDGSNILRGALGADTMTGGLGNDTYFVDTSKDVVLEKDGGGTDTVISKSSFALPDEVGNLTLAAQAGDIDAIGNELANKLVGNEGDNTLDGGLGADTMIGGAGDDLYIVDVSKDVVTETLTKERGGGIDTVQAAASFVLGANVDHLELTGSEPINGTGNTLANTITGNDAGNTLLGMTGDDSLVGNGGGDALDGGAGGDTMDGGAGDDTYFVDSIKDVIAGDSAGNDTIVSKVTMDLSDNKPSIENVILVGGAIHATGNSLGNALTGTASANILDGGAGADSLTGGSGNDTLSGGADSDTLDGGIGNDSLSGDGGNDSLIGGAGNDTLDGGDGNDTMDGGAGKDVYVVDSVTDKVTETDAKTTTGGVDTVLSQMFAYTLAPFGNVENLTLGDKADDGTGHSTGVGNELANVITGNDLKNTLVGLDGNDKLIGNGGDDTLVGAAGNDTLDGGAGNDSLVGGDGDDSMAGGLGDDRYSVDAAKDRVSETITNLKGGGSDTVESSITYTLGANLDDLVLNGTANIDGTGNTGDNRIFGDGGNNKLKGLTGNDSLVGNGGDDTLDGGTGVFIDTVVGGTGDDTYILDSTDVFIENAGEGTDTVQAPFSIDLLNNKDYKNIENVTLLGSAALVAIGSNVDNLLIGNTGANTLTGNDGNDTLDGGRGNDSLVGGKGDDVYGVDSVKDVIDETGGDANDNDTVKSSISINLVTGAALYGGIEHVELTGKAALKATGDANDNKLTGNDGNNTLDGGDGADTMKGGLGNDIYIVNSSKDITLEDEAGTDTVLSDVSWELDKGFDNLTLAAGKGNIDGFGNELPNKLIGNEGNNLLSGGLAVDTMIGGAGDDTYVVNDSKDVVTETLTKEKGGGIDTVHSAASFVLGANVDHLVLTGSNPINGTGNTLANSITGNDAANTLLGMTGDDSLVGNGGNDVLDGGAGSDTMVGGVGDDIYFVDSLGDIIDKDTAGKDTIVSKLTTDISDRLDIENVVLVSGAINATGNSLANKLTGSTGANSLDGGVGVDTMIGGIGNDTYFVDSTNIIDGKHIEGAGDITFEEKRIGWGVDTVISTVDQQLLGHIEKLTLVEGSKAAVNGWGSTEANVITGNSNDNWLKGAENADTLIGGDGNDLLEGGNDNVFVDSLDGGAGNDTLDGGKGGDRMNGGDGDDLYFVDSAGDRITDSSGTDTVKSSVTYTLGATLEHLELTGALNINGTGNALDNEILGNLANNKLTGLAGNDTIDGGFGHDTLAGGVGNDSLIGGPGVDTAVFTGKFDDYEITPVDPVAGKYIVKDTRTTANNDGEDTLEGIDRLQFADKTIEQNQAPDIVSISNTNVIENDLAAVVGKLVVTDPNADEIASVTVNDPRFQIVKNGVDYQLQLKAGESLDFEDKSSFDVVITATDPLGANSDKTVTISVLNQPNAAAVDGYIAGGTAFTDVDGDGVLDGSEPRVTTDIIGRFELGTTSPIAVTGGTDIATGLELVGVLRAQAGSTAITPLTTLAIAMAEDDASNPLATVPGAFDFTLPGGTTINTYDPVAQLVAAQNLNTRKAAGASAELYNTAVMAASFIVAFNDGDITFDETFAQVFVSLAQEINGNPLGAVIDLSDAEVIADLLVAIDANIGGASLSLADELDGASAVIAALNDAIEDFVAAAGTADALLAQIAATNIVAQTTAAAALASLGNGGNPNLTQFTNETQRDNLIDASLDDVGIAAFKYTTGTTGNDTPALTAFGEAYDGLGGNDTINGGGGNDTLFGGAGNDKIDGGIGNDSLIGGWGNDTFVGGLGTDTVIYDGNFADYTLDKTSGDVTVTDKATTISNNDGKDGLSGIEFIQFADKLVVINQAPVAVDDTGTTNEDTPLNASAPGVLGNDTDTNPGDTLVVSAVNGAGGGVGNQVTLASGALLTLDADGSYTYDPNGKFESLGVGESGTDSFEYTVSDGNGGTDIGKATITITGVNDAPDAVNDKGTANENAALVVNAAGGVLNNDTDVEDDTLTVTAVNGVAGNVGNQIALASGALLTLDADGSYTYDPNGTFESLGVGENGADSFTYTISDGNGGSDTATVNITVTGVNDAPDAVNDTGTTNENAPLVVGVAAGVLKNDTDVEGDLLIVSAVNGVTGNVGSPFALASGAMLTMNADGSYTYNPNGKFESLGVGENGADSFTYTISDGNGGTDTATVNITITGVNDAPVAVNDKGTTNENAALVVSAANGVLKNDTDVEDDALAVTAVNGSGANVGGQITLASGALLTLDADGSYTYDPNGQFESLGVGENGADSFTYTISDGNGGSDTATVNITVTGVNDAPVAVDDVDATGENTILSANAANGVLENDTDADGDALVVSAVAGGTVGTPFALASGALLTLNADGSYTYNPNGKFDSLAGGASTTDSFEYTVSDGQGGSDVGKATITINGVNDDPVASPALATGNEDASSISIVLTGADVDGTIASVTLTSLPSDGTLYTDAGLTAPAATGVVYPGSSVTFFFVPDANFNGDTTFNYTVTDNQGAADATAATATITVNSDNDAPVAQADKTVTVAEDAADTALNITAPTDVDGNTLTITVTSIPNAAVGTVYLAGGVTPVTNGMVLTLGQLTGLVFRPAANANGAAGTFTYSVTDGNAGSDTQTVTLDVTAVNDAPVAQADKTVTVAEDAANTALNIAAPTDVDGNTLTITVTSIPNAAVGTVYLAGGVTAVTNGMVLTSGQLTGLVFRPAADANGAAGTFSYSVADGNTGSDTQTVTLNVTAVNDAPVAQADKTVTVAEDAANTALNIAAPTDVDGDALTITVTSIPNAAVGTVYLAGGVTAVTNGMVLTSGQLTGLVFRPAPNANSAAGTFSYSVTDGNTGSDTQTVTLDVTSVNDAPAASTVSASGNEGAASISIVLTGTDVDGTIASVRLTSLPANGTLYSDAALSTVANTTTDYPGSSVTFFFVPGADFNGDTTFNYTVTDNQGAPSTAPTTATITVNPVDDPPGIVTDADGGVNDTVDENAADGTPVGITAFATDPDGDAVTYSLTDNAGGRFAVDLNTGVVTVANGALLDFEANPSHNITVQASSSGGTSTEQFTININDVAEGAITDTNNNADSVNEHAGNGTDVGITAFADDPSLGDNIGYTLTDDAGGRFAIDMLTGVVSVANGNLLDFEAANSHDIEIKATGSNGSVEQIFTIAVADVDPENIIGDVTANSFIGGNGNDTLNGGLGDDTLNGGGGDDLIIGGVGDDTLEGGIGSDRFVYNDTTDGSDTIMNFQVGSGGDVIDISDVLSGYDGTSDLEAQGFVVLTENPSGDTLVNVDPDATGGNGFTTLAVLSGVGFNTVSVGALVADGNLDAVA